MYLCLFSHCVASTLDDHETVHDAVNHLSDLLEDHKSPIVAVHRGLVGSHEFQPSLPLVATAASLGTKRRSLFVGLEIVDF